MDKIEKLLGVSATAETIAERLTEIEIVEIQEELEEELNSIDNVIEISQDEKGYHQNEMKKHESAIADLDSKLKTDTQRKNLYTKVNENLKIALTIKEKGLEAKFKAGDKVVFTKSENGLFTSGDVGVVRNSLKAYGRHIYHIETPECAFISAEEHEIELHENELSPNKQRAELTDEAKRFAKNYEEDLGVKVHKEERVIYIESADFVTHYRYPQHLAWNEHIAVAYSIAKTLHDFFGYEEMKEVSTRFGEGAPQPDEIVEECSDGNE